MANTSYFDLYKALKADGAVQGDWNSFHKFVGAQGKQGYLNRKKLYDALKADGAVQASTYEEFNNTLFRGGQASLKAAQQRHSQVAQPQRQTNARTQAHARNNNGSQGNAATQQPQTASQRALQMVTPQNQTQIPENASPFVRSLYRQDVMNDRDAQQMDYSSHHAVKDLVSSRKRNQQISNQVASYAAANQERYRRNQPIVNTGSPEANQNIVKTQGQLEDEIAQSGKHFVDSNMGGYIDDAISQEFKEAHQRGLQAEGNDYFQHGTGGADWFVGERKYQQQVDPDTMIKNLSQKLGAYTQSPDFIKQVEREAASLGISPEDYARTSVLPSLVEKASGKLMSEDMMRRLPKGTLEYITGGILNSMTGALLTGLTTSKQQRQNQQNADSMTEDGKNPNYQPGTWAKAGRGTLAFIADAPEFGLAGKAGAKVAGKVLGEGVGQAAKVANMNTVQRMGYMASQGALSGGVTGFTYGATNAAVQNYSTGEDTSLGNTLKLMTKGGLSEAASFAVMSGLGGAVGGAGYGIGINGTEKTFGGVVKNAAKKLGYEAVKTAMEGVGMWAGGNMARLVEGSDMNWSIASGLESAASAAMFKLMHAKDLALGGNREKGEKLIPYMKNRITSLFVSDAAKNRNYAFTTDEKNQLFGYGYENGMADSRGDILKWAKQANDTDPNTAVKYYDGIMKDPNVSWDTKAKFSALVMGVIPTARPMADHVTFTNEKVGDERQGFKKYINEYAADGTLLSKHSYDTKDERDRIMFRQIVFNEDAKLNNAYALAIGKDTDNRLTQSMFLMSRGYNTSLPETEPNNQRLILGMRDKDSELYNEFRQYCINSGIVGRAWTEVIKATGMSDKELSKSLEKEPYKRSDKEQAAMTLFRKTLSGYIFEPNKPHPEQSAEDGKDVVAENNLGTDQPNNQAVLDNLHDLKQSENEMAQLMSDNDIFSDNFKNLQQQGLTHPQIYDWMIQNGMTEEQLAPYAHYMNAVAKVQGMQNATAQAINEHVEMMAQDWGYHGTMDGLKADGSQMLYVQDRDGRMLIVGSGDVSYDPVNGHAKEGVGDMLVCLDPNTRETVYVRAEDTTLFQTQDVEAFKNEERQRLQSINSVPYNQAAQEQAAAEAAEPQPKEEAQPNETVADGNKMEQPQQGNAENFKVANSLQGKVGGILSKDEADALVSEMENRPEKARNLPLTPENWKSEFGENGEVNTPLGVAKMGENQLAKMFMKGREAELGLVKPTLENPDVIIEEASSAKDGDSERPSSYLFVKTFERDGKKIKFYASVSVKKDGMEVVVSNHFMNKNAVDRKLQEGKVLYIKGMSSSNSSDMHLAEHPNGGSDLLPTPESDIPTGGKDTNISLNNNDVNTTLTFKDGSPVPVDANGEPDFMQMSPEQGAELYKELFPRTYEAEVDNAVKMLEADLKKLQKATPKSRNVLKRAKEQAEIDKAIDLAEAQITRAKEIKKALEKSELGENTAIGTEENVIRYDKEREQGFRVGKGNVRYDRQKPEEVGGVRGKEVEVAFSPTVKVKGHAKLVELDTVQASHSNGQLNLMHFGHDWQPKDRTSTDSKVEAEKIAGNIDPKQITGSDNAFIGSAPSVNERHEAIQGNNRVEALKKMYSTHPDQAAKYKQWLIDHAGEFGLTPEDVAKMEKPVIVNELPVDDATAKRLGQKSVNGFESGGKRLPDVTATINKLVQDNKMQNFINQIVSYSGELGDEASIGELINSNYKKALEFLNRNKIIDNTEYLYLLKNADERKQWILDVMKSDLFGGDKELEAAFSNLPNNIKNAIYATYLRDTKSKDSDKIKTNIRNSFNAYNDLEATSDAFRKAKDVDNARKAVEAEVLNGYNNVFGDTPIREKYTNFELELAALYKGLKDRKTLTSLFNRFYDDVQVGASVVTENGAAIKVLSKEDAIKKEFFPDDQEDVDNVVKKLATEITNQTGVTVHTDEKESQKALEEAEKKGSVIQRQAMIGNLAKAANVIKGWLKSGKRGKTFTIDLPISTQRMIKNVMGRDFDSHNITANGVAHARKNHGIDGNKIDANSIPLRDEDFELMPYIMTSPDYVRKGSTDASGRESIRFYKDLHNGYVVVAEKEYKNSTDDMETITMWAEKSSSEATNAHRNAPDTHVQNAILSTEDAAKIRKDAELAIENDVKLREHRVFHGSQASFDKFDHSFMGSGEGAQAYGWGTYFSEVEGIARSYAKRNTAKRLRNNKEYSKVYGIYDNARTHYLEATSLVDYMEERINKLYKHTYDYLNDSLNEAIEQNDYERIDEVSKRLKQAAWELDVAKRGFERYKKIQNERKKRLDDAESLLSAFPKAERNLYTVEIPDDNGFNYIGWDNPLTEKQKEMWKKAAISLAPKGEEEMYEEETNKLLERYNKQPLTGEKAYGYLTGNNTPKKASLALKDAGFDGVKVIAQRNTGGNKEGRMNYVIFDENKEKIISHTKFFRTKDGEIYGFVVDGEIHLDTKKMKPETPLHEYTHLWTSALQRVNAKEWENVKKLLDSVDGLKEEVQKLYPELKGDDLYDEMLATYSGREGTKKLEEVAKRIATKEGKTVANSAKAKSFLSKVKEALQRYWKGVADMLGIHFTTAEEVADKVLADWAKGVNPNEIKNNDAYKFRENDRRGKERYGNRDISTTGEVQVRKVSDSKETVRADVQANESKQEPQQKGSDGHGRENVEGRGVKSDEKESSTNPVKAIEESAAAYRQEKIDKAAEAYKKAKESGDEEQTTKAAKTWKHLMDENLKGKGYSLRQRQAAIALQVGKKEAETIDKPLDEMDSEELEFVASKNPLTESEIRELAPAEDKNFVEDAVDYVNGNHGFAQKLAYLKIYKDVRSRYENAPDYSGAKDGTQLAPSDNGSGEGLGLGTGRDSGGSAGQMDRGTGNEPAPGERGSGESGENDPHLPAGEQGDKQGEGTTSRVDDVPARGAEPEGGSEPSGNGNVPERGGQDSGGRPAEKNARRKPTAKQGTTWRGRSGEEIKKNVDDKKAAALAAIAQLKKLKYGKGGSGNLGSMELMTPEQIEYLPTVANAIKDYGMAIIDQGIYKVKDWLSNVRDTFMDALKDSGFTETEVDRFIKEMWNSKMTMDGETHTIEDWCSIYGQSQLRKKLNETLDEKRQRQMDAEPINVKVGNRKNIEETLPYLLPEQQEDVYRAETQFFGKEHADREHAYGKGYMFTNGTGTGKTYTGLGIAKRLVKQGKKRILFVTPSDKKVKDWIKDGKNLGLDIRSLDDWAKERGTTATTENGDGCVITTFANFGVNKKLLEAEWDAVIYDESHRIMENKKGTETSRSMQHYKVSNRDESHCFLRLQDINPHYQKMQKAAEKFAEQHEKERKRIISEYKKAHPSSTTKEIINATYKMMPKDINGFAPADGQTFPKLGKLYNDFKEAQAYYYNKVKPELEQQAKDTWKNTKTVFLSATPFNTRENLDYAEGYIFKYPEEDSNSRIGSRARFYLDHFGAAYKWRYNRLESSISNPEAVAKQEVAFSDYLQNNLGTMSGRIIDSPYDYSRDFPTVAPDHADAFNDAVQGCLHTKHLYSAYLKTIGDYNYGSALFETMKVANSINRIKEHLAAGRKVVIYHRRVESKEPIRPPFEYMLDVANQMIKQMAPGKERDEFIAEANEFREKHQDLLQWEQTLDYSMPREQIAKVFGKDNVLFFSGKESKKVKDAAVDTFNSDASGKNILVIQEASGKEGISLHDTTGEHQRVVITLALPQSPITALQIEGRIYRIGNMSNAIFEYPILGLNSEMMLFGQKFNNQVSTTENLALGSQARNLRDSFAKGILEHSGIVPIDQQGVGGKVFDAPKQEGSSDPFDDAVFDYYSNQKLNKNNREGVDYFPTPEPLGYKMVQWAGLQEGDSVLEPSAGHGAIARYVPQSNDLVNIEPSQNLFSRLQLKVGGFGRKFLNNTFENYDIHNKHDAIIMNPPFGKDGATAIQHLDKAFRHLDEGGRIVALIPRGITDKKFDAWLGQNKDAVMRAEVNLPDITFQQAGTNVMSRVVILDKVSKMDMREKAGSPEKIDLSGRYDKIEDFFEDLRNIEMPDRIIDTNFKVQKKSRQTVKDLNDIKGVRKVDMDKNGINVKLKGNWMEYAFSFVGSEKPDFFKKKMASYYQQYKEFEKDTWKDDEKAVFNEFQKLACKLAGMTEEEMERFIKNGNSESTTHFREDRGIQYSKTDEKDVKNSRIIPEDVDKSVSSQIEKKFDETINDISSSAEEKFKEKAQDVINRATAEYSNETREVLEYEKTNYENEIAKLHRGTSIGGVRSAGGSSQNTGSYRLSVARANLAAIERELAYRDARAKVIRDNYGLSGRGDKITPDLVERIFKEGNPSNEQSQLFTKAYSIAKRLGVDFTLESGDDNRASGEADINRNINLFLDGLTKTRSSKDSMSRVLLHEMLHQATMGAINLVKKGKAEGMLTPKQIEGVKTILDLYDKVKDDKERFKEEPYGLKNEYEFAAQMADPRQRKALDLDVWDRIKNAAKELANKGDRSMWQTFKDAIKKLFEISDKDKMDQALNYIMDDFNEKIDDISMNEIEQDGFAYKVEDKDELDRLNKEKTFRMYSGMQEVDGKLYSPMAAIIGGKRTDATEMGVWMRSDERPDLVSDDGKFTLVKTDKPKGAGEGDVDAAYNPYMHTSSSMMNDQFSGAYARGNIKVVEWEIPESEKTSGYHADGAKDAVGLVPWHSGSVNGLLPKDRQRSVMLSRWRKAVRVVPDSEVAESIAEQLRGTGLAIPWNVVTPNQLRELAKLGVPITTKESGTQSAKVKAKFETQMKELKEEFPQSRFVDVKMTQKAFEKWGKNGGTHFREDRSSEDLYNSLKDKRNNRKDYNDTVTELADRVKQGTARIVREGKEDESGRTINRRESLPAIAGQILLSENQQGNGQVGGRIGEASRAQGEKVLQNNAVYGQIEEWAKENGYHFTESDIAKESLDGDVWKNGWEANVYRSKDDKSVIKVMPLDNLRDNPIAYSLDRNRYFNEVFPDTAIEVIGYGKDNNGDASVIFKQPLVDGKTVLEYFNGDKEAANDYIDKFLEDMGYSQKVEHDEWGGMANTNGKYTIFDVNDGNIIIDKEGKPHVIDAEVLPVDYKNDGKIEIKDSESTHFRTEDAVRISDDAPVVVKHVDKIAKQVGGKVKMIQSVDEITNKSAKEAIEAGRNITGWYDEKTGEVHLYMPNIHDRYTAEKTIWHEVVGHKGMRELFGDENYSKFLRSIWYDLDKPENARLKELVGEELKYNPFDFENGIEEGIARLVEDGKGEPGFWNAIKNKVTDILHEIGYRIAPNTKDVKYLLWLGKNLQKNPNDPYWKMKAEAVRYKLDKEKLTTVKNGEFSYNDGKVKRYEDFTRKDWEKATDMTVHFRTSPSAATEIDIYNRAVGNVKAMAEEAYSDKMNSVLELYKAIDPSIKRAEDVKTSENPYMLENLMSSRAQKVGEAFVRDQMNPLTDAFDDILGSFSGEDFDAQIRNANLYMVKKSGLERNRAFFVRDAIRNLAKDEDARDDANQLQKDWDAEHQRLKGELDRKHITLKGYFDGLDDFIRKNVDADYDPNKNDYSGFHEMQEKTRTQEINDALIQDEVMSAESSIGDEKKINNLWNAVKAATDYSLDMEHTGGFMDRQTNQHVKGEMNWYVPMRMFDKETAEDIYGYIEDNGVSTDYIAPALMRAKGRTSMGDLNILAQIGAMGEHAINRSARNAIKQALARFVNANEKAPVGERLVTELKPWLEKVVEGGVETWVERYPQIADDATQLEISQAVENFENSMKAKELKGEAKQVNRRGNIPYRFADKAHRPQHIVDVWVNGRKKSYIINGNPRAAQAINGMLNHKGAVNILTKSNRWLSQVCTSYNPEFTVRNAIRDYGFASHTLLGKEGVRYFMKFEKHYAALGFAPIANAAKGISKGDMKDVKNALFVSLFKEYKNGTLDVNKSKYHKWFKEFMDNGGETGYLQMKNVDAWKKQIENAIKDKHKGKLEKMNPVKAVGGLVEDMNQMAENIARFATFCASREVGRNATRSAYDAKEVSVNFNRSGSAENVKSYKYEGMSSKAEKARNAFGFSSCYLRNYTMFFNASVQSFKGLSRNIKNAPAGTIATMIAAPMSLGLLMPLVNQMLVAALDDDEKDRKGVKDPYAELPEYVRRNNVCIYTGKGRFVQIPIAIEGRAFYGLGDIAASYSYKKDLRESRSLPLDIANQLSQIVPVGSFMESSATSSDSKAFLASLGSTFLPSAFSPAVELIANRDWKGQPIYNDATYMENAPAWKKAYSGTSEMFLWANKKANALTNDVDPGNEDMKGSNIADLITNPFVWEQVFSAYAGGMGTSIMRGAVTVKHALSKDDEVEVKDIPFARSFFFTPSSQTSLQRTKSKWYNYKDEVEDTNYNLSQLKHDMKDPLKAIRSAAAAYKYLDSPKAAEVNIVNDYDKRIGRLNKILKVVTDNDTRKSIEAEKDRLMMEAVDKLDKLE